MTDSTRNQQYEDTFLRGLGLRYDPFSHRSNKTFITSELEQIIHSFVSGLYHGEPIYLFEGVNGVGKTTLLKTLAKRLLDYPYVAIESHPMFTADQVNEAFARLLKSEETDLIQLLRNAPDNAGVIFVDDAHELSPDALAALFKLATTQKQLGLNKVVVVMFAEPEIHQVLKQLNLPSELSTIQKLILSPLSKSQTEAYIRWKIDRARAKNNIAVSQLQLESIWYLSRGVPAKINRHGRKLLPELIRSPSMELELEPSNRTRFSTSLLILIGILFLGGLFFQERIVNWLKGDAQSVVAQDGRGSLEITATPVANDSQPDDENSAITVTEELSSQPTESAEPAASNQASEAAAIALEQAESPDTSGSGESDAEQNKVATEAEVAAPSAVEGAESARREIDQALIESTDLMVFPDIQSRKSVLTKDELQLRALPPQHFSLQLLAVSDNDSLQRFVTDNPALSSALVYRRVSKDNVMYILLAGDYPDRKSAEAGIASFPDSIRELKPWVKRVSVIQEDIENTESWLLSQ